MYAEAHPHCPYGVELGTLQGVFDKQVYRRRLILAGFGLAGVLASARFPLGAPAAADGVLPDWERTVCMMLLSRICAGDGPDAPSPESVGAPAFVVQYVAQMPGPMRREFRAFLLFIEHAAPALARVSVGRWSGLSRDAQNAVLLWLDVQAPDRLASAFASAKSLFYMAYYRAPATWALLGYDGPKIGNSA